MIYTTQCSTHLGSFASIRFLRYLTISSNDFANGDLQYAHNVLMPLVCRNWKMRVSRFMMIKREDSNLC